MNSYKEGQHARPLDYTPKHKLETIEATGPKDIQEAIMKYNSMGYQFVGKDEIVEGAIYNILFLNQKERPRSVFQ